MYDYLLVGAGLFNAIFANEASRRGKKCLVIEKRNHIGGNCYTEEIEGIVVHKYGAHIFRTSDRNIWDYVGHFAEFNNFINSPIAIYKDEIYNLPFNMNTFSKMWNITTPNEAKDIINKQKKVISGVPNNLEDYALSLVGTDIYEKLIKGYTEKQWGKKCKDLSADIMRRIPLRFTYDNNYYNARYQGVPIGGYTPIFEKMLKKCDVELSTDYLQNRDCFKNVAKVTIFTGAIDSFFDYCFGELEYRSLEFEEEVIDSRNYQGVAVTNYTDVDIPYTRIIEHKHFEFGEQEKTVITKEFPLKWDRSIEPYYPINNDENNRRYAEYLALAKEMPNFYFAGRLGSYQYYDMQDTIRESLSLVKKLEY